MKRLFYLSVILYLILSSAAYAVDGGIDVRGNLNAGNINDIRIVDGEQFATIQDAINDLPASGGKVFIPSV